MLVDSRFMARCIQLAEKGTGYTSPNPKVGAVIVYGNTIIGEGYHQAYGLPHAEVNAINSVCDKSLLTKSTLYVSLEPCAHYGKTPPCAQLIIDTKIPRVVIGCKDPFPLVSGKGIEMLNQAKVETLVGVMEEECKSLNQTFFFSISNNRPYVILKWAETKDGFIDKQRINRLEKPYKISNDFTSILTHKLRSEVDAILVGTNTALLDNPSLNTRLWYGKNPIRIVIDKSLQITRDYSLLDNTATTIIATDINNKGKISDLSNVKYIFCEFTYNQVFWDQVLLSLKNENIQSLLIEGGAKTLQSVIDYNLWDEASVEVSEDYLITGVKAPDLKLRESSTSIWGGSKKIKYMNYTFKNL